MPFLESEHDYSGQPLRKKDVAADPFVQFAKWFDEARAVVTEPTAMSIATISDSGQPSTRTVLMKDFDENGFTFFTNYHSRKGREIDDNANVALLFFWQELSRQVRIDGIASRISREEVQAYFSTRERGKKLSAWASSQSEVLPSRDALEANFKRAEKKFEGIDDIPVPDYWGGYRIVPHEIEFWQGQPNRLHDRLIYRRATPNVDWTIERLSP